MMSLLPEPYSLDWQYFSCHQSQYDYPDYEKQSQNLHLEGLVAKTSIIAFSDPNDLLSYAIPQQFGQQRLDSRLCAEITNININVYQTMHI
jgi:hypothetical protein